jgi:hypothetical protein
VYYIIYFITNLKYKRQDKKKKEFIVNCDDSVSNFLKDEKYKFTYNVKNSIKDNIESAVGVAKNVILDVATINDKNNNILSFVDSNSQAMPGGTPRGYSGF